MGIFGKKKEKKQNPAENHPGMIFMMQLLFKDKPQMPDGETAARVLSAHMGEVQLLGCSNDLISFAAKKYLAKFKDGEMPPTVNIFGCADFEDRFDEMQKSQMWDCMEERDRILSECRYMVLASDMLAATLTAKERAELDMDYLEALLELFPDCEAVFFQTSEKLLTADSIRNTAIKRESRFIKFAVNARFFNIEGTDDMMVDTLGMSTLFLPDLQYHFHGADPSGMVFHAYNIADYILNNDNPIKDGDSIDGIRDGNICTDIQWKCHYEDAMIKPDRLVIDIEAGEFASGTRNYTK